MTSPALTDNGVRIDSPPTPRDLEVLRGLAAGWTQKEVAQQLRIDVGTIKKHVTHMNRHFGTERLIELLYVIGWTTIPKES